MKRTLVILGALLCIAAAPKKRVVRYDHALPVLGTKLRSLPAGEGKSLVEESCLRCHSTDILFQQHITAKQWTAGVDKMIKWGAEVKEKDKATMIAYLVKHFGPENNGFTPARTRPVGY